MSAQTLPRWATLGLAWLAVSALVLGCSKTPPTPDPTATTVAASTAQGPPYFEDVTARSGISFTRS